MYFKKYVEHSNMEEFIKVPKFCLSMLGVWPLGENKYAFLYYLHSLIATYSISFLLFASVTVELYGKLDNILEAAEIIYFYLTEVCYLIKLLVFTYNRKRFLRILDELENPIFFQHRPEQEIHLKTWAKFINIYSYTFLSCCFICFIFYTIFPLIDPDVDHILPIQTWFPFDVKYNLTNRACAYIFQILGLSTGVTVTTSMDVLLGAFINISCAQLEILKDNLENATVRAEEKFKPKSNQNILVNYNEIGDNYCEMLEKEADDFVDNILCRCIEHHHAIIKFLSNVEALFNTGMFAQFIQSGVTVCIAGLQLITVQGNLSRYMTTISYMGALLLQITCYCWSGHLVTVLSSSISESCYNTSWYRCSLRVRKTIFIIMERCKKPIKMTAGTLFVLSIVTLTALLRSAYSYFAILQRLYKV